MALTLQKKLELAGDLAKVQPMLQRLHLVEKPKQHHRVRNVILVSAIGAGAVVAVVVCSRRCCRNGDVAGNGGHEPASSPTEETPPPEEETRPPEVE